MMNVDQITTRLSMMDDAALQKFAAMNKSDPYLLPLAISESNRRQRIRMAGQAQQAMPQPKVADAAVAQMQPAPPPAPAPAPEQMEAGISQLPARNIEGMADGGIAGFAEGKRVFSADKYLENPMVQRFLDYINVYEGSPKENQTVGYHKFDDLSQHPNKRVKFNKRGDKSTAAGAYQLINRTWQDQAKKQGLTDFSLENQKRAAIGVLKETGALDALMNGDIEKAKQRAARAWASIPGSTIGEATGQKAKFNPRAEQVLADVAPPKMAEDKKPAAPKRQQTAGLDPKLAKELTNLLPIASAQAGELPRDRKAAPAAAGKPTPDLRYKDVPGTPDAAEYERQLRAARPPEPSYLEKRGRELLGAPEAVASAVTGVLSPLTGTIYAGGRTLAGKPTTAEEGFGAVTFAPRSEYGKESLAEMQRAFEDFKIPPFIPGVGTTSARPKAGKAITKAEAAAAEAATAAEAASARASEMAAAKRSRPRRRPHQMAKTTPPRAARDAQSPHATDQAALTAARWTEMAVNTRSPRYGRASQSATTSIPKPS